MLFFYLQGMFAYRAYVVFTAFKIAAYDAYGVLFFGRDHLQKAGTFYVDNGITGFVIFNKRLILAGLFV